MATLKYYAQKDAYGFPIPGTMMGIAAHLPVPVGTIEIPASNHIPNPARKGQGSDLRYFVRHDKKGNIIPNSLIATIDRPSGLVYEFQVPGDGINDIFTIPAPSALSYTTPNVFTQNVAITALSPTVTGPVASYSVAPALPVGLILNTTSGVISGTPTAINAANTLYTVTATNPAGSTTAIVIITVNA